MNVLLINPCLRPNSPVKILPVGLAFIATALSNAGHRPDIPDIDLQRFNDDQVINTMYYRTSRNKPGAGKKEERA